jgi:hypothetical protein
MVVAERREALPVEDESAALERQRPEVAAAVQAYLKLGSGDPRRALGLAVCDAIDASRLVSRGFARRGGPGTLA